MNVLSIARLTFSVERHRTEILILVLMGFLLAFSMSLFSLNPTITQQIAGSAGTVHGAAQENLMLQGGLFYSEICLFLVGFLVAMNSLSADRKSGIMDVLLSKALTRDRYLLGKLSGGFILCSVAFAFVILPILGAEIVTGQWGGLFTTALAYLFGCIKILIYLSLTFFFLMRLPRILAPFAGLVFIAMGYFSQDLWLALDRSEGLFHWAAVSSYYMIPHLTEVTVATVFDPVARSRPDYLQWFLANALVYPGIFIFLSLVLFRRKSL